MANTSSSGRRPNFTVELYHVYSVIMFMYVNMAVAINFKIQSILTLQNCLYVTFLLKLSSFLSSSLTGAKSWVS